MDKTCSVKILQLDFKITLKIFTMIKLASFQTTGMTYYAQTNKCCSTSGHKNRNHKKQKQESYDNLNRCRDSLWQNQTFLHNKTG